MRRARLPREGAAIVQQSAMTQRLEWPGDGLSAPGADPVTFLASYWPQVALRSLERGREDSPLALAPVRQELDAALLFADIAGFTPLTERLARQGAEGPEAIARVLNVYLGRLVEVILAHGGDVVKFAGDALLAMWPASGGATELAVATKLAAQSGLEAQGAFRELSARDGSGLSMRVGVGAGRVATMLLGGVSNRWSLLAHGPGIREASASEGIAPPGQVVVGPAAWDLLASCCRGAPIQGAGAGNAGSVHLREVTRPIAPGAPSPALQERWRPAALLRSMVPESILWKLSSGQETWLGELRRITCVFIHLPDLEYPVDLSRAQEGVAEIQRIVYQYEGSLNKINVDGKGQSAIAVFGLPPVSHEEDPVRGVRAGLAIQKAVAGLGWTCSVGVATGSAFCGEVGSRERREYTILGDVVNVAARLMQTAHGGILADEPTFRAASSRMSFSEGAPVKLKGKSKAVAVYTPQEERLGQDPRVTPLFGRIEELSLLHERLERLRTGRQGAVFLFEGEAGIGKSRLIAAAGEWARECALVMFSGAGDALRSATLYHAWHPVFSALLGLETVAPEAGRREAHAREVLAAEGVDLELAPLLNEVLQLRLPQTRRTAALTGPLRADNTREILLGLLRRQGKLGPFLLVLDDAHWLDGPSMALLHAICREELPAVTIVGTRPPPYLSEAEHDRLAAVPGVVHRRLEGLGASEIYGLLCQRLGVGSLPLELVSLISARSAGHPLFSEELAYHLRDTGVLAVADGVCRLVAGQPDVASLELPGTVQALLTSRIDRLPAQQQMLVKVASVIGFDFTFENLRDVHPGAGEKDAIARELEALEHSAILICESGGRNPRYRFKHALVQDVAYGLLTFSQRRHLHREVARWHEWAYKEDLSRFYPTLAHHWKAADEPRNALKYLDKAGEQSLNAFANEAAARFLAEAAELEARMEPEAGHASGASLARAHRQRCRGVACFYLGRHTESVAFLKEALTLLAHGVPASPTAYAASFALQLARQLLQVALHGRIGGSSQVPDETRLEAIKAHHSLFRIAYDSGNVRDLCYSTFCALNLSAGSAPFREQVDALAALGMLTSMLRLGGLADSYLTRAVAAARELDDLAAQCLPLSGAALHGLMQARMADATRHAREGLAVSEKLGDGRTAVVCEAVLGGALNHSGEVRAGLTAWQRCYRRTLTTGDNHIRLVSACGQSECAARLREPGLMTEVLELGYQAEATAPKSSRPDLLRLMGSRAMLFLARGETQRALATADTILAELTLLLKAKKGLVSEAFAGPAQVYIALAERESGDPRARLLGSAQAVSDAFGRFARTFSLARPRALWLSGTLAWLSGKPREARAAWTASLALSEKLGMRYESAWAGYHAGRMLGSDAGGEMTRAAGELLRQLELPEPSFDPVS